MARSRKNLKHLPYRTVPYLYPVQVLYRCRTTGPAPPAEAHNNAETEVEMPPLINFKYVYASKKELFLLAVCFILDSSWWI
mmetsp:Transcript_27086/g.38108  ORF Transcript_27086/g.38108 Transcript_27086/m.38108 type:complete len:81 (+) Transcript_27086:972-1214(+)